MVDKSEIPSSPTYHTRSIPLSLIPIPVTFLKGVSKKLFTHTPLPTSQVSLSLGHLF
ncbi:unnamed protein product [Meloidogyne enterolobii]|uniref:Uncharacterized protein n=1 Tax=Meloidogyne enterolobii TaxID=390850 RepID=A0ACB0ZG96_MELEN